MNELGLQYMFLAAGGGAYVGMRHSHMGLGYLLLVVALINIALSLSASKTPRVFAKFMRLCHNIYLFGGRANVVLGIVMVIINTGFHYTEFLQYWWIVTSILLWGVAEVVSKRLVKADLNEVQDGIPPSKNLSIGFCVEFAVLVCIYLCMIYR